MVDRNEIGAALPDYLIERELGQGGMGVVFLGRHARLGRLVAIKELPPTFANDPDVRDRFSTEARTLAALSHPHIVPIYDYVERDGLCLIVMEELPGGTVWDRFTTAGLTPPTACAVVLACCAALQHAHEKGVLHLDVKPDNLMYARDEAIKVTDFGISRVLSGDHTLGTADGQVLGTPAYMSPEQARSAELTQASDVYSAGVMLYELLSGHLPWTGAETATELLLKRLREDPRPLTSIAPQVPDNLAAVVMRAIEREPEKRYASAEDFGVAIATACADAWGPSWLDFAGVSIIGSDRLSIAARTTRSQPAITDPVAATSATAGAAAPETTVGPALDPTAERAAETTAVTTESSPRTSQDASGSDKATTAGAVTPPMSPPEFQVVRAAGSEPRIQGLNLREIEHAAFVDVAQALGHKRRPWRVFALASLCVVAALIAAAVLFTPPPRSGTLARGDVAIDGHDVTRGQVPLDLSRDLSVRVHNRSLATRAQKATLRLSEPGLPLAELSTSLVHGAGAFTASNAQYVASGSVTAQLELHGTGRVVAHETFPARVSSTWYLTVLGLGGLFVILAGFAYFEGALRPLRRGRLRVSSLIACGLSAAVMLVGGVALATALGWADPTATGLIASAAFAALGGVVFGIAVRRRALRRGVRRAVRRAHAAIGAKAA